jgi:type II secretory pathway predicted ATPase ExeA
MFRCHVRDRWLFPGQQLTEARNRILYLVENLSPAGHLAAVDGSGRSTALTLLQDDLRKLGCGTIAISLLAANAESMTQQLAASLAISTDSQSTVAERLLRVREELLGRTACGRHIVLLLDDAHRCDPEAHSAIEFLHAVAESSNGLLCLVTAGDMRADCPLARRSPMRIPLEPLPAAEANAFLQARLTHLGIPTHRVTSSAIRTLVEGTQGLPRRLLHVCSLVEAVCESQSVITMESSAADAVLSSGLNRAA